MEEVNVNWGFGVFRRVEIWALGRFEEGLGWRGKKRRGNSGLSERWVNIYYI